MAIDTRRSGEILSRNGRNYIILSDGGGKFTAEADAVWPLRARVVVVGGMIIARAGVVQPVKYFEV